MRYYLTPEPDPQSDEKIVDINRLYQTAQARAERGEATISTDEMTGVQALSPKHADLPMRSGSVLRREFEYERHGTLSFMVNFDVASGQVGQVSAGPTRNEADFLAHVRRTVEADPGIVHWGSKANRVFSPRWRPDPLFCPTRPIVSSLTTPPSTLPG